jgi:hypothetical protein
MLRPHANKAASTQSASRSNSNRVGAALESAMTIPQNGPANQVAFYSERLDADLERFERETRRASRRLWPYAVLGAVLVVVFGVWGFGVETNTRNAPVHLAPPLAPGSAVTVTIHPG